MPKVWCAAIECKDNKNNQCKAAEINLSSGNIHTKFQGFKQVWECRNFELSEEYKRMMEEVNRIFGGAEVEE